MQQNSSQTEAIVYSQPNCPGCNTVKQILNLKGYKVTERMLGKNATLNDMHADFPGARTVPQVVINGTPVGGLDAVKKYLE